MEKQINRQLELFSRSEGPSHIKRYPSDNLFLNYVRNYEKTVLIIITIVTSSIISFSLGVERGKKLSMSKFNSRFDVVRSAGQPVEKKAEKKVIIETRPKEAINTEQKSQPRFLEKQGYVIQIASYKNKSLAQKEADVLKKQGFAPLVMSKGAYTVLCVGNIANKEKASSLLSELKKRYSDCYIRRL
jgi:hypothetical protein